MSAGEEGGLGVVSDDFSTLLSFDFFALDTLRAFLQYICDS